MKERVEHRGWFYRGFDCRLWNKSAWVSLLTLAHMNCETLGMLLTAPCLRFLPVKWEWGTYPYPFSRAARTKYYKLGGLKQLTFFSLTLLKAEVWNQNVSRAMFPLKPVAENPSFPLVSFWWLAAGQWHFLACHWSTSNAAFVSTWCSPFMSFCLFYSPLFIKNTRHIGLGSSLIKISFISSWLHLQRP